jgi:cysteine desulfurase
MNAAAPVYLDHNATTAVAPAVLTEMMDTLQRVWANPSSTHGPGQAARRLLVDARARAAQGLGCQHAELVFTSGATEANHTAVLGALRARQAEGRHRLVLSAVEHPGLLALAQRLRAEGVPVDLIPVDSQGRLNMDAAHALVCDDVALVSVMGANNETGVCLPVAALSELAHERGAWLHVDATQWVGRSNMSFQHSGADLMSVSAHKLAGPKGVGALLIRKGVLLPPLLSGRQERHRRGGTENLPGIAGFAAACELMRRELPTSLPRLQQLRQQLEAGLLQAVPDTHVYGRLADRLPNTCCVRFAEIDAERVLDRLERAGVIASSGAACSAGGTQPSHVLLAMGESERQAKAGVRFSLGPTTQAADIAHALAAVQAVVPPLLAQHEVCLPEPA